ncbi:MAG: hypothetical protein E7161_03460 [Firmicutes bacterium]|nr:hypothetical protein [Bacillota bacterium]
MDINKKIILGMLIIVVTICLFWNISIFQDKAIYTEQLNNNSENISNMFAVMIGDLEGNYTEYEGKELPKKENGYIFNPDKSVCYNHDGEEIAQEIKYRNNIVKMNVTQASYCYLYFDIISESDFCMDRGITNLKDCLLVMEDYSFDVEEAIEHIESKGDATTSKLAPTIYYQEQTSSLTTPITTSGKIMVAKSYYFDESTGYYRLKNTLLPDLITDDYLDYYTCGNEWGLCASIYQISGYSIEDTGTKIIQSITSKNVSTYKQIDSYDSEIGLYATLDEEGTSYFYRGAVKNNYVSYAGFIWRIIRINGNGSIRMIYSGTSTDATGKDTSIETSLFNSKGWDPTYVGYKYGANFEERETSELITYKDINHGYIYYYGEGYVKTEDGRFQLDQDKMIMSGRWSDVYEEVIEKYPYTCVKTSPGSKCNVVLHLKEYVNSSQAKAYYISNSSKTYESTLTNQYDSTVKSKVDTWYENNILNKTDDTGYLLSDYLSDETFCNDRSLNRGDGYLLSSKTYYNPYTQVLNNNAPSLICPQSTDEFKVSNGNLKYPIALITADEASFAGGDDYTVNKLYYLYTGQSYWTMTPMWFTPNYIQSYVGKISANGGLSDNSVGSTGGIRPVINLKSNIEISQGTGTKDNPYVVKPQG